MRLGTILLLALPLVSLAEMSAHRAFRNSAPTNEDWQKLEPVIAQWHRGHDLVVVVPGWADPLLRQSLDERFLPLGQLGRADDETLERVIEVSFGGAKGKEFANWHEREQRTLGPFLLRLLENPQFESVRMRLIERVRPADLQVFEGPPGDPQICTYTAHASVSSGGLGGNPTLGSSRFACPSGEPYLVTVTTIDDQEFAPRRCIWAHPSPQGPLTLRFRDVWLGSKLVGHGGLPWLISRDGAGSPIHFNVKFEGDPIGTIVIEDTEGWKRFEWSTMTHRDQRGDLEIVVSSEQSDNRRFCFTLESR